MRVRLLAWIRVGLLLVGGVALSQASATSEPQPVYRCGSAYANQPDPAANCKLLLIGRVTVLDSTKLQEPQAHSSALQADVDLQGQRAKQAYMALQAELQRAQMLRADLLRAWNNGEPERRADEIKQAQKYQDRVMQLKQALQRLEADIAGLERELVRVSAGVKP